MIAAILFVSVAALMLLWPGTSLHAVLRLQPPPTQLDCRPAEQFAPKYNNIKLYTFAEFFTPRSTAKSLTGVLERPPPINSQHALCGGFVVHMCCLSSDAVRKQAGYDGYMLSRLVRYFFVVFAMYTVFSLAVLVPTCYTASDDEPDAVTRAGLDNIPEGSQRLWAFTVSAFVMTGLTCTMIFLLAVEYAVLRRAYLRSTALRGAAGNSDTGDSDAHQTPDHTQLLSPASSSERSSPATSAAGAGQVAPSVSASPGDQTPPLPEDTHVDLQYAAQCAVQPFGDDGSTTWPRTVMALDVPPHVTNSSQLLEMFNALYPGEVQAAVLVSGIHGVLRLKKEREWQAQWYDIARWEHTQRVAPSQRVVYARRCRFIACLWRECFHWDPIHTEEGEHLQEHHDEAEQDRLQDAEYELHKHEKKRVQVPALPEDPQRFVINAAPSPSYTAPIPDAEDAYAGDERWVGPDSDDRGAYCCCCLPCGSCKRGRACHCLVANKACCGSVQPALPRLRNELLRTNALLRAQRHAWWRRALPDSTSAADGSASPGPAAGRRDSSGDAAGNTPAAGKPTGPDLEGSSKDDQSAQPAAVRAVHAAWDGAKPPKVQKGGTGFITFRTARQAVTAANSYHLPAQSFDTARGGSEHGSPPPSNHAARISGEVHPASSLSPPRGDGIDDSRSASHGAERLDGVDSITREKSAPRSAAEAKARATGLWGVWGVLSHTGMSVKQAPHPLDVNFHSCTLNSSQAGCFRALVGLILFLMLLVYSVLAVLLAAGGGESGDASEQTENAGFFTELYEGVIQSVLLSLLLALLPTFMHLLGRLSRFKERHEVRTEHAEAPKQGIIITMRLHRCANSRLVGCSFSRLGWESSW